MDGLRIELVGQPVRVSEIDPGMVETEFSLVRFDGDKERAESVYRCVTPLSAGAMHTSLCHSSEERKRENHHQERTNRFLCEDRQPSIAAILSSATVKAVTTHERGRVGPTRRMWAVPYHAAS